MSDETRFFILNDGTIDTRPSTGLECLKTTIGPYTLWMEESVSVPNGYKYIHDASGTKLFGTVAEQAAGKSFVQMRVPQEYKTLLDAQPEFFAYSFIDAWARSYLEDDFTVIKYITMCWCHRQEAASEGDELDPTGQYKTYRVSLRTYDAIVDANKVMIRAYIPLPVYAGRETFEHLRK